MKFLTPKEEVELLDSLYEEDYVDCGSSRAVYFGQFEGHAVAVKVWLDAEGALQGSNEVDVYNETEDDAEFLAEIYAVGHNCIVMEALEAEPCYVVNDAIDYYEDNSYDDAVAEGEEEQWLDGEKYAVAYEVLCNYTGVHGDNYQLGLRDDGSVAAYDYGYTSDIPTREQVGSMGSYIDYGERTVIDYAIFMIENEMDCAGREETWADFKEYVDYE